MRLHLFACLLGVALLFAACKGDVGPQGTAGTTGLTGAAGATGPAGVSGVAGLPGKDAPQPVVYDYTLDLSKALILYDFPKSLESYDVPLTYIMTNKGSGYAMLPFRGYAYTADQKDFIKLDTYCLVYPSFLSYRNDVSVPTGATFYMRTVVLKGAKGGRIDAIRYADYGKLKADYNLPD